MIVLCLNRGSSSLKHAVYAGEKRIAAGQVADLAAVLDQLSPAPDAVAHRFVHGGPRHHAPSLVTAGLLEDLAEATPFAPLHLPGGLQLVREVAARYPHVPQVICFDTDFHWNLPEVTRRLPLPRALYEEGVRRYGFHGLSYQSVIDRIGGEGRVVIAHLGNGASLVAVRDGRPIDTSMGFTPAGGIMMGTRSGDLDPGVAVHLLQRPGFGAPDLERLIDRESGLLGVSGLSGDLRELLASEDPHAALAVEMFCYQVRQRIGAYAATLGGLEKLVFTGGIGENALQVRARICAGLGFLGIALQPGGASTGRCVVQVVPADEERVLASSARALLGERSTR